MRALKNISLIFLFCIVVGLADKTKSQELIAPKEQNQTIATHSDTNKLADAIADRVSNAELHKLITEYGRTSISVKQLPPMNGPRRVGFNEPRFFIVVQNSDGQLAVIDLRTREFGQLNFVSRLRSTNPTASPLTTKTRSATNGVGSGAPPN
jgi:hypothetical protein